VPFVYVMFAHFIMKFRDECESFRCNLQHFVILFMPVIVHRPLLHVMLVGIVMLWLYCEWMCVFPQNDGGWTHYCVWCGDRSPANAEKARCSKCVGVVCKPCMERNFDGLYGANQCAHMDMHGGARRAAIS
jgi:hypothetical protein